MELMNDILKWAKDLPYWQQLIIKDVLEGERFDDDKIAEITKIAVSNEQKTGVLDDVSTSGRDDKTSSVTLKSIKELSNINNLLNGGSVDFLKDGLTVIYGENGAGKSGYSRILKKCCRSRDKNCEILKNIHDKSNTPQSAKIVFDDGIEQEFVWQPVNETPMSALNRIHVFDRASADVYLSGENAIEYRPSGMDILDKLISVTQRVREKLDTERSDLKFNDFSWTSEYDVTKATELVLKLDATNAREQFDKLTTFTSAEEKEHKALSENIPLREKSSPIKEREKLVSRNENLKRVATYTKSLVDVCSDYSVKKVNDAITDLKTAEKNAEDAKKLSFDNSDFLSGTGNETWKLLWESARKFAEDFAYKGQEYPSKESGTKCVLCQRELEDQQIAHMDTFSKYVLDESQETLREKQKTLKQFSLDISSGLKSEEDEVILVDLIKHEYPALHANLTFKMSAARDMIRKSIIGNINKSSLIDPRSVDIADLIKSADAMEIELVKNKNALSKSIDDAKYMADLNNDKLKLAGLESRKDLLNDKKSVLENIENHKKSKKLAGILKQCNTTNISNKSGELSKKYIVEALETEFDTEIRGITRGKVGAKLIQKKIVKGMPMSKIVITLSDGAACNENLTKILSDGELRGASIAGFMAELSMGGDKSAIIFDDPISSLDHIYSQAVAERICREAKDRQVIIFTHDMLFLTQLLKVSESEKLTVDLKTIRSGEQAGVVEDDLPPEKMAIKKRISRLNDMIRSQLEPLYKQNKLAEYQEKGSQFYKELRQSWERLVEEVLFGGVIERFDSAVHTRQLSNVDIEKSDIGAITAGMTECSKYLHDQPDIVPMEVGKPEILKDDLKSLTNLKNIIVQRRK